MRDIEEGARALVLPLIFDAQPLNLADHDVQERIATWVYLRTLVIQAASDPQELNAHYYHQLEETHRLPTQSFVWLGFLTRNDPGTSIFFSQPLDANAPGVVRSAPSEAYAATLSIGFFVGRVFVYSPLLQRGGQFGNVDNPPFNEFLVPIWPLSFNRRWPPKGLDLVGYMGLVRVTPLATTFRGPG